MGLVHPVVKVEERQRTSNNTDLDVYKIVCLFGLWLDRVDPLHVGWRVDLLVRHSEWRDMQKRWS